MPRELIAKDPGFYRGNLIERGKTFTFFGEKTPKWAAEKTEKVAAKVAPTNGDTKPADARKAAKAKAESLMGADQVV